MINDQSAENNPFVVLHWVYAVKMWVFNRWDEIKGLHQSKTSSVSLGDYHADKMSHELTVMSGSGGEGGRWWRSSWFLTWINVSGVQVGQRTRELSESRSAAREKTGSERKQTVLISAFCVFMLTEAAGFCSSSASGARAARGSNTTNYTALISGLP